MSDSAIYLSALMAILVFVLALAFILPRWNKAGAEFRFGIGLMLLGTAFLALWSLDAIRNSNWRHVGDILLFRSGAGKDHASAGIFYVTMILGLFQLVRGMRK
jgi:hypothetical protein